MTDDEEFGIYDDLDEAFMQPLEKDVEKKNAELEEKLAAEKKITEDFSDLKEQCDTVKKKNTQLNYNMSYLLETAQKEIKRKDQQIAELRKELDTLIFKRNKGPPKNIRSSFTQTYEVPIRERSKSKHSEITSYRRRSSERGSKHSSRERDIKGRSRERDSGNHNKTVRNGNERRNSRDDRHREYRSERSNHPSSDKSRSRNHNSEMSMNERSSYPRKRSRSRSPTSSEHRSNEKRQKHEEVEAKKNLEGGKGGQDLRESLLRRQATRSSPRKPRNENCSTVQPSIEANQKSESSDVVSIKSSDSEVEIRTVIPEMPKQYRIPKKVKKEIEETSLKEVPIEQASHSKRTVVTVNKELEDGELDELEAEILTAEKKIETVVKIPKIKVQPKVKITKEPKSKKPERCPIIEKSKMSPKSSKTVKSSEKVLVQMKMVPDIQDFVVSKKIACPVNENVKHEGSSVSFFRKQTKKADHPTSLSQPIEEQVAVKHENVKSISMPEPTTLDHVEDEIVTLPTPAVLNNESLTVENGFKLHESVEPQSVSNEQVVEMTEPQLPLTKNVEPAVQNQETMVVEEQVVEIEQSTIALEHQIIHVAQSEMEIDQPTLNTEQPPMELEQPSMEPEQSAVQDSLSISQLLQTSIDSFNSPGSKDNSLNRSQTKSKRTSYQKDVTDDGVVVLTISRSVKSKSKNKKKNKEKS